MDEILVFIWTHKWFSIAFLALNIAGSNMLVKKASAWLSYNVSESAGNSSKANSLYDKCKAVVWSIGKGRKCGIIERIADNSKARLAKCGAVENREVYVYVICMYFVPILIFAYGVAADFPNIIRPIAASLLFLAVYDSTIRKRIRKFNLIFRNNAYKIYKYLHNQVESGVRVTDAIKSVYEMADDIELRKILTSLAARYELTLDIEKSLGELRAKFKSKECETLCTALKLGVTTGDSSELLSRQEDIMFKKYFAHIQAETDMRKARSMIAVGLFSLVLIILIVIPLIDDLGNSVGKIFIT